MPPILSEEALRHEQRGVTLHVFDGARRGLPFCLPALLEASVYKKCLSSSFKDRRQNISLLIHAPSFLTAQLFMTSPPFPPQPQTQCFCGYNFLDKSFQFALWWGGGNRREKKKLFHVETLNEKHSHGKLRCARTHTHMQSNNNNNDNQGYYN